MTLFIQTATLLAALHVSGVRPWVIRVAVVISGLASLSATGILISSGELGELSRARSGSCSASGAGGDPRRDRPPLPARRRRHDHDDLRGPLHLPADRDGVRVRVRAHRRARLGAVLRERVQWRPGGLPLLQLHDPDDDRLRRLDGGTSFGRAIAITEPLFGQIYLVTVVALIVGTSAGPGRLSRGSDGRRRAGAAAAPARCRLPGDNRGAAGGGPAPATTRDRRLRAPTGGSDVRILRLGDGWTAPACP